MRAPLRAAVALAALTLVLAAPDARANGRFPAAQQVVFGRGAFASRITFRTTLGLLVSDDGGGSFRWLCESALYNTSEFGPAIDPAVEIDARGRTVYGFFGGVRWWSQDQCGVTAIPDLRAREVLDLTSTPDGGTLYGIETPNDATHWILRARADDLAFTRQGEGVPGVRLTTVDVTPTDPERLYLSGLDATLDTPLVLRSDDGGRTVRRLDLPARLLGEDVFVAAVDPRDADTFWLRANIDLGSSLVRVRGGGASAESVARTADRMLGFARSDDGRTVWYGSLTAGLFRSDDGGDSFTRVNDLAVLCLAAHEGALWACGDWLRGPFALGRSTDGGRSFAPVLQFRDLAGPARCAAEGADDCAAHWPMLQQTLSLAATRDAGAPRDASRDVSDVSLAQGPAPSAARGCGCQAGVEGGAWGAWGALAAGLTSRRAGRSRARGRSRR